MECLTLTSPKIVVLGGADIYAQALPLAARLLITHVDASPAGDAVFPAIDPAIWTGREVMRGEAGAADEHAFTVVDYGRSRQD
ncbi:dihydrofolate reductase [Phreatobacter sp.]|uniref:dihydrofolate reductase n=1 Tax=Phreatobacter sp. TaxID=1966341 RepID=UPI003F6ED5FB